MAPHDHSLRGWAGGAYRPVGGSQGVESPQQSGVRIARAGSESCGVPLGAILATPHLPRCFMSCCCSSPPARARRRTRPGAAASVAAWSIEGRTGAALALDRSPSRPPDPRAERHFGVTVLWMATTNLGYLDRRLWDNAGSIEISPSLSTTVRRGGGETVWRASAVARIG